MLILQFDRYIFQTGKHFGVLSKER